MKLIKPSVEWWGACPSPPGQALRWIEKAGRTCYKSEDKITEESAPKFVKNVTERGHLSVIEHSNAVFRWSPFMYPSMSLDFVKSEVYFMLQERSNYHTVKVVDGVVYIGGNLRAWLETIRFDFKKPIVEFIEGVNSILHRLFPTIFQPLGDFFRKPYALDYEPDPPKEMQRYTVKWVCDRGVSHEIVRHRPCSFSQESTRYCDYNGKDMEFVEPAWWSNLELPTWSSRVPLLFLDSCAAAERYYKILRENGQSPQLARAVLPNSLKTEIVITADLDEWNWIFNLRTSPASHPDMQVMAKMTKALFIKHGLIPAEEEK